MMNLANSIYTNFRNSVIGYKLNHNEHNFNIERGYTVNCYMTNYMIESNNKANKLYNKLNTSSLLLSKILKQPNIIDSNTDIEYDHNNETIICHKQQPTYFIRKNSFELILVFVFGVLAHFHFQRSRI
jgi:hypothetical protein